MNLLKFINGKAAIISAGIVLVGYLVLILTVINLGQNRLKASHDNELQLKVAHYAYTLGYFFSVSQDNMSTLANDKTITTFFYNRNSGMSMAYGLGASLFKLETLIQTAKNKNVIDNTNIFNNISILNLDGSSITSTLSSHLTADNIDLEKLLRNEQSIHIEQSGNDISITLLQLIYLNGDPLAFIAAEINNEVIIQQLTAQEYVGSGSHIELMSEKGNLFIWDSLKTPRTVNKKEINKGDDLLFLEQPIKMTPLTLIGWYEPANNKDLFTSNWFVVVISTLAIPVLFGLYWLIRVEHNNAILQTEVSLSEQQKELLSVHNFRLEREISKRKASEKVLKYQATHDLLTDLANRNYSLSKLEDYIELSKRQPNKILVMYIDLDNFKQINDTLGHSAGDQVLVEASQRLLKAVRKTDTVARLSGDEFLLILPNLKDHQQAMRLAADILTLFEQPFDVQDQQFFTSSSIGLSIYPQDGETADSLLKCADIALYRVKESGRNSFSFYDSAMNANVLRNLAINRRLRHAIENNKLEMYYQPLVNLQTGEICGAEALMRWTDEELGFVSPEEFILLAERNGLIHQIGEFALTQACQQAAKWQAITPMQISVNFSSVQFRDCPALLAKIIAVLNETGLPKSKLDIEVTESLMINKEEELSNMFAELRALDIQLSIDDFGTGYSALSYLQKYAFTKLKIDRAFVMNLSQNAADRSLVKAIIAMAKALDLKVVAEGIEEQVQADFLKELNCEFGQGYLFSKPLPADEFEKLLIAANKTNT